MGMVSEEQIRGLLSELSTNKAVHDKITRGGGTDKVSSTILSLLQSEEIPTRKINTPRSGMIPNDTVERHQKRMLRLLLRTRESFNGKMVDLDKLAFQVRFHDIDEMIEGTLGDIPTPVKEKLSPNGQQVLKKISQKVLTMLAPNSAKRFGYTGDSVNALSEVVEKTTLESKILKWFDYIDAYMCTLHEISLKNDNVDALKRRQKAYIERMIRFIGENPAIFRISTSDFLNKDIWGKHFGEPKNDFLLYQDWAKLVRKK